MTCSVCLGGRHGFRCEGRSDGSCDCNVCGHTKRDSVAIVVHRAHDARQKREQREFQRQQRAYRKRPGPVPGAHGLKGRSTLTEEHQQNVVRLLDAGVSISQIARSLGCSRDKIRTIKQRQEALGGAHQ